MSWAVDITGSSSALLLALLAHAQHPVYVPGLVSEHAAADLVWALEASRTRLVVREPATVEADRSVFFTSIKVAVQAVMRAAPAFYHPAGVGRIRLP